MISMLLQLTIIIIVPLSIVFLLVIFLKTKLNSKISPTLMQMLIGIIMSVVASLSTYFSVNIGGEVISVRNAIVLSTGFIFGAPAGIIAGVLGAIYRFFAVFYVDDLQTQMVSTVVTAIAGFIGGALRVFLFDRKAPKGIHGFFIAITIEILHILLIILTSIKSIHASFLGVQLYAIPMIAINGIFTFLALTVASWKNNAEVSKQTKLKSLTQSFESWLVICLIVALGLSTAFIWSLQTRIAQSETSRLLSSHLHDIRRDILAFRLADLQKQGNYKLLDLLTNDYIGLNGGIIIANGEGVILSDRRGGQGKSLHSIGLNLSDMKENEWFLARVYEEIQVCMYLQVSELYLIAMVPRVEALFDRNMFVYLSVFMQVLVLAVMFALVYILVKNLVIDNIKKVKNSLADISGGNLNTLVDIRTNEEFSQLSNDINATVTTLKKHIEAEKTRIDTELEFARTIQLSSLPSVFPPYPHHDEFSIFASMDTAKEVGGDFYDFYFTDHEHLAFLVADVSGKGIAAAIFMMRAKTLIKGFAEAGHRADDIFALTNKYLCENNEVNMFVTAWLGILNIQTGQLCYVNAGHNPPLLKCGDSNFKYLKTKPNFVLALADEVPYESYELNLKCGDEIFLYTDGITEAVAENGQLYGEERLQKLLDKQYLSTKQTCISVLEDVNDFAGEAEQADDITMLCLKFQRKTKEYEIFIHAAKENIPTAIDFVNEHLENFNCSLKAQNQINIAMDEILSNIMQYAYGSDMGQINIKLEIATNSPAITLHFIDSGVEFNPLLSESPDTSLPFEMRKEGGLGIHILKQIMDDVSYEYKNGQNILSIQKKI